jgi:hypothetical protein
LIRNPERSLVLDICRIGIYVSRVLSTISLIKSMFIQTAAFG